MATIEKKLKQQEVEEKKAKEKYQPIMMIPIGLILPQRLLILAF